MPFEPEFRINNTDLPVTSNFLGGVRSIQLSYGDKTAAFLRLFHYKGTVKKLQARAAKSAFVHFLRLWRLYLVRR